MRNLTLAAALLCSVGFGSAGATPAIAEEQQTSEEERIQAAAKVVQGYIDAGRANDFERSISYLSHDVILDINGVALEGRDAIRQGYQAAKEVGLQDQLGKMTNVEVLESGWNGLRVYVWLKETYSKGFELESYTEFEVSDGKITTVLRSY